MTRSMDGLVAAMVCWLVMDSGVTAAAQKPPELPSATQRENEPSRDKKPVNLRPKYVVGRESRYTMKIKSTSVSVPLKEELKDPSEKVQGWMEIEIGLTLRTKRVNDDGSAEMEMVYESFKFATDSDIDIETPEAISNTIRSIFKDFIGTTVWLRADADGNTTSVTDDKTLSMFSALADMFAGMFGTMPGASSTANWILRGVGERSPGSREIGECWTHGDKLGEGGGSLLCGIDMITTHTLKNGGGETAEVEFVTAMKSAASPDDSRTGPQLKTASDQGLYVWDTQRGELLELTSKQTSVIQVSEGHTTHELTSTQEIHLKRR